MTNDELHTLKALAEAATPGPWHVAYEGSSDWTVFDEKANIHVADVHRHRAVDCPDARFIAAANPQTVLALLAEVERLREEAQLSYQRAFEAGAAQLSRSLKEIGRL